MTEVASLLSASQQAHLAAQKCRAKKDTLGHLQCLSEAYERRKEAHETDPDHADAAWAAERVKRFHHGDLIRFYAHELEERIPAREVIALDAIPALVRVPDGVVLEKSLAYRQLCREHGHVVPE